MSRRRKSTAVKLAPPSPPPRWLQAPYAPVPVTGLDMAFPASVRHLMPAWEDIPGEFKNGSHPWDRFFSEWFYWGLKRLDADMAEGVEKDAALRHLKCVMGSFEPKHEHKGAAVVFLASKWFKRLEWAPNKPEGRP